MCFFYWKRLIFPFFQRVSRIYHSFDFHLSDHPTVGPNHSFIQHPSFSFIPLMHLTYNIFALARSPFVARVYSHLPTHHFIFVISAMSSSRKIAQESRFYNLYYGRLISTCYRRCTKKKFAPASKGPAKKGPIRYSNTVRDSVTISPTLYIYQISRYVAQSDITVTIMQPGKMVKPLGSGHKL